jgi:FSR family fosmidomycin resistance protein-like MFS transporter
VRRFGYAIGPLIATVATLFWALKRSVFLIVPTAMAAGVVTYSLPRFKGVGKIQQRSGRPQAAEGSPDAWIPFAFLSAVLLSRSVIFYGLNTFLPLFWVDVLHRSKTLGGRPWRSSWRRA